MDMGKRIETLRKQRNLSQRQLSTYTKLSNATISRIESGGVDPDSKTLTILSEFFDVPINYLMGIDTEELNDPDFRRIERARKKMPEADKEKMMKILELSFSKYFSDDFKDADLDE